MFEELSDHFKDTRGALLDLLGGLEKDKLPTARISSIFFGHFERLISAFYFLRSARG